MKKVSFSLIIIATLSTACKKNYNCNCVATLSGGQTTNVTTVINNTKSKAQKSCTDLQTSSNVGNETISCTIK